MDDAIGVLTGAMNDRGMFFQLSKGGMLVGRDQADIFRNGFTNDGMKRVGVGALDDARDKIAVALNCADDSGLPGAATANVLPIRFMFVLFLAADVGFINFDDTHKFAELRISKTSANTMAHIPSRTIRAEAHHAMNLQGRNSFPARQQEIDDLEPVFETDVGIFKNCPN
jgi:hypothetical protein